MAERRMFTKKITESDAFLEMPSSAQNLYFHLNMEADDDGFVNAPKKIMRMVGASDDDIKLLILKKFVIVFESGVIVIKHWRMHNLIRADRHHDTQYQEELKRLEIKENKAYRLVTDNNEEQPQISMTTTWQPDDTQMETEVRLGKDRLDKSSDNAIALFVPHDDREPLYHIQLKEKDQFQDVYKEDIDFLQSLYPDVNVEQEVRNMVGWSVSNPTKRKTRSGIKAFITRWMNNKQNKVASVPDELRDRTRMAYIKEVERKLEMDKRKDEPLFK